ncbi:hypothetical protein [Nocardia farcinica]|uniref:hypothetical protein n=1 Tax=Nocardia farcinica TaxID=37329 RepID=UPI002457294E|nr:hypothetical protein [Nocardia farcinica]
MTSDAAARRARLETAYRNARGPVAYLDESYQVAHTAVPAARTFYIFTAVVVEHAQMEELRAGLVEIAGSRWWHTTEALQSTDGRAKTEDMLSFLSEGPEVSIISLEMPIGPNDRDGEAARRACYRGLASQLAAGGDDAWQPVDLLVLEERNQRALQNRDARNHRELLADKLVPRGTVMHPTSPAVELLLWLPDLVSSAYRRSLTHHDQTNKLFDIVRDRAHFVDPLH